MKKPKVCHMTSVHAARDGRIFHKQCASLAKAGYETYLVAPGGNFTEKSVTVVGVGPKPSSRIKRMLFFSKKVYKTAKKLDADIYHFHDPELLPFGLKLKKQGKKVIFDAHEHYEQTIAASPWMIPPLRKPAAWYYARRERGAVKKFDAVICVTPTQYEPYKAAGVNVYMITNYPIVDGVPETPYQRNRKICFAGGIKPEWMHENIINVLIECDAEYVLAGPCSSAYLEKLRRLDGWKRVDYKGMLPFEEVSNVMRECAVGIAVADYNWNNQGRIGSLGTNKVFEYMRSGIPIICTEFKLWKEFVERKQCGICVNPNDAECIVDAIKKLLNNPNEAEQMGNNGREAVEELYNWETQNENLLLLYENFI